MLPPLQSFFFWWAVFPQPVHKPSLPSLPPAALYHIMSWKWEITIPQTVMYHSAIAQFTSFTFFWPFLILLFGSPWSCWSHPHSHTPGDSLSSLHAYTSPQLQSPFLSIPDRHQEISPQTHRQISLPVSSFCPFWQEPLHRAASPLLFSCKENKAKITAGWSRGRKVHITLCSVGSSRCLANLCNLRCSHGQFWQRTSWLRVVRDIETMCF